MVHSIIFCIHNYFSTSGKATILFVTLLIIAAHDVPDCIGWDFCGLSWQCLLKGEQGKFRSVGTSTKVLGVIPPALEGAYFGSMDSR